MQIKNAGKIEVYSVHLLIGYGLRDIQKKREGGVTGNGLIESMKVSES